LPAPAVSVHTVAPTVVEPRPAEPAWSPAGPHALPAAGGLPAGVEPPYVALFAQMQQLMAEQFQQAMGLFVEAFWTLQREQARQVRRELRRIRRLTEELTALQAQLGRDRPAAPTATGASDAARRPVPPAAGRPLPPAAPSPPREESRKPERPPAAEPHQSPAAVHAWLSERIAAIQNERQKSWQWIRDALRPGAPAPPPSRPDPPAPPSG
jgi:hypothetical protein